ncbi:hypothetical protein ACT3OH_19365 [Vreelandella zhanjiangensis]|uniref:hypothetical protein n=1 Tax=Halomonas hibernica TaxID=2591147 RepID=UPI001556C28F|nr:hypothetical protein [Halomonas hibernica]
MASTPPPNPPRTGIPKGLIRAIPTPRQLNSHRRELRRRANEGDTLAIGLVVLCEVLRQQKDTP